jgi:hypothetical protein
MTVRFCTLAMEAPYRRRARQLCADVPGLPWLVLTDAPADFADLPVTTVAHAATGPMASDYLRDLPATGGGQGAAAYHDKRFALQAALRGHASALYVDADSRITSPPPDAALPPGIAVLPVVRASVATHLATCGAWRRPAFEALACALSGNTAILDDAMWCHEALVAITGDGREARFFDAWSFAAEFLQARGIFSGEGGVIGLAAAHAGWTVDFDALRAWDRVIAHEGGGPKAG